MKTQNNSFILIILFLVIAVVTTIEGLLTRTIDGLMQDQPVRRHLAPDDVQKIDEYVDSIQNLIQVKTPFQVVSLMSLIFSICSASPS